MTDKNDYWMIICILECNIMEYSLPENKALQVVITCISEYKDGKLVDKDLEAQGFHPNSVTYMTSRKTDIKLPLYIASFPKEKPIFTKFKK